VKHADYQSFYFLEQFVSISAARQLLTHQPLFRTPVALRILMSNDELKNFGVRYSLFNFFLFS